MLLFIKRESDYFWHIKAGEYMFKNGPLKKDVFSWFVNGKYWMSHEWLFEIVLYFLKVIFKGWHMIVYCFLCLISLLLILFFTNKKDYLKNNLFTLIWFTFFLIFFAFVQARPHLISFNFLALTMYLLYDLYKNKDSKKIYFLPLITILWANFHGGSSNLPYLLCLVFLISGMFSFKYGKIEANRLSKVQLRRYFCVMLLCMGAVLINLHGVKMFFYPYENMANTVMISNISEWQSTTLSNIFHYPYFLMALFVVIVLLVSKKKIELIDFLMFGFALFLGLKSIRFWPYIYIIMSYVIFKYVKAKPDNKLTIFSILFVSSLFLLMFVGNFSGIKKNLNFRYLDDEIIELIKDEKPKRLYNMYNYGGELVYNDIEVFIDGRADLYSLYNYEDYLNISKLENDYVKLIDKYDFDYFLVDKSYSIYTYLKYNDSYEKIFNNKDCAIYKKRSID